MADTVIENLITQLSFDFDEEKLEEFQEGVETAAKGLVAIVGAAAAAATAIFAFTKQIAEANDELGKFAQRIGVDIEALQELGFVAELNGGSIDSMNASLANLSRVASEAARGMGPGVEVFGMLGISVTDATGRLKQADDLLLDVADAISRLGSQAERLEFAQKLGIGEDLLLAIQQGSEAIKQQRKEARELGFVIDVDAAQAAADFQDEMLRLNRIILGVTNAIGTKLMKQIEPMIEQFVEWFKANKAILQQNLTRFLDTLIKGIRGVFNVVMRVVSMVNSLVQAMGGWKAAIVAVTGVLIAMNASALLMPVLAVAAGAAILLILEDIITFAKGGDSALGQLTEKFPVLESLIWGLLDLLAMIRDGWLLIFSSGDEAFEGMVLWIQDLRKEFALLDIALSGISLLFNKIIEGWSLIFSVGDQALEGFIMMIKDIGTAIQTFILDKFTALTNLINKIPGIDIGNVGSPILTTPARAAGIPGGAGGISNITNTNNTSNPNIVINVNGGDTEQVKRVVSDVLSEQYSGAQTNLESQVEY